MSRTEELVNLLIEKGYTISFAESCTGGKMAAAIVDVADASKVLNASFVTYSNEAKMKYANVSKETLDCYGAVSEQTAGEMAKGTAVANNADVAVGISGIAGPTGGTADKPVGTVCFGYYINGKLMTETVRFPDDGRNKVRDTSVEHVTEKLIYELSRINAL
ncbi:MAG: CinA family protein [Eubacterium sp.]